MTKLKKFLQTYWPYLIWVSVLAGVIVVYHYSNELFPFKKPMLFSVISIVLLVLCEAFKEFWNKHKHIRFAIYLCAISFLIFATYLQAQLDLKKAEEISERAKERHKEIMVRDSLNAREILAQYLAIRDSVTGAKDTILARDAMNANAIRDSVTGAKDIILAQDAMNANAIRDSVTGAKDTILAQDAMNANAIRDSVTGAKDTILAQDAMNANAIRACVTSAKKKILAQDSKNANAIITLLDSILKEQEAIKKSMPKSEQDTSSSQQ